ncbi:MAG: type I secretion system permease/ATPase, partial [Desulfovibrio sp.]|nr:type I secretion system permease/ATPase [Desulfovibrio sp.]
MREFLHKCRYFFKYAFFFSLFINILQLTFPIYMMQIYDKVLTSFSMPTLWVITFAAVIALIVMALLEWIRSRLLVRAGVEFDHMLSGDVLHENLLNASQPGGVQPGGQGTLGDVNTLRNFLAGSAIFAFFDMPWMPIFFLLMFLLHPWLGYVGLAGGVITFFLGILTERATRGRLEKATRASAQASAFTNQVLRNADLVRAMGMIGNVKRRWSGSNDQVILLQTQASSKAGFLQAVTKAFRMGQQVIIYAVGAYLTLIGDCTAGVMIAASIVMGRAVGPIAMAMSTYKLSVNAHGAYKRLDKLFAEEKPAPNMDLPDPVGEISCENLYFAAAGRPIIKGVSFRMPAGQSLAIIGPSAAGKSTLCKLLLNLWKPTAGKVRIDRADIQSWNPEKLGPFLGYLPQDVELFSGTVAENIARMGQIESDMVIRATKLAGAHNMILALPRGYDTQIGNSGNSLSGGQRQRVGLARALYGDPRIVILDEPNANLDEEGDACLHQAILNLRQLKATVIIVTHKAQILNIVDNIMVMQDGQIAMCGRREDVLRDLANMQKARQAKARKQPEPEPIDKQQEALQDKNRDAEAADPANGG